MSRERDDFIEAAISRASSDAPSVEIANLAGRVFDLEEQVVRQALGGQPWTAARPEEETEGDPFTVELMAIGEMVRQALGWLGQGNGEKLQITLGDIETASQSLLESLLDQPDAPAPRHAGNRCRHPRSQQNYGGDRFYCMACGDTLDPQTGESVR